MCVKVFLLALLITTCAGQAYLGPTVAGDFELQDISWNPCGGAANVSNLIIDGCPRLGCTMRLNQRYNASFNMITHATHTSSSILVTASRELLRQNLTGTIQAGRNHTVAFPLLFNSSNFSINATEIVQVRVTGANGNRLEFCGRFIVFLGSANPNNGTQYDQTCQVNNQTCAFTNSLCKSNKCQCDDNSVENNRQCKLKVNKLCYDSNQCLANGECVKMFCQCKANYKANTNGDKCSSGAVLSFSVLLLTLQQFFVFLRK